MFMFLFILKLLITAFLRNCSKGYMQDGLVSESLASKLHFSDLAMGFCLASYKFLFIHFHLGQSTDPENHVAACRHPSTSTLKQTAQSAKAREGFSCTGILG